ncbi:uncharacterized protein EI90DRAFT_3017616 [Cantharellus anzutake]|uniref:uncharacterized protein n=1 Tax=Cantharellus anzutake TaxID=1750568 RepID=UPI0019061F3A|nr:uncharacterized protein EI90DRAFT_3017616 [Cantharellus anzutake]KAF8328564.1 hypothetical protein EI90DRAFT_3017616 [Cantharellus anzutake]
MHLQLFMFKHYEEGTLFPDELLQFDNHNSTQLLRGLDELASIAAYEPWELYRSKLHFAPPSIYKQYGHLADPVRIFSAFGEFSGGTIPLSEDLLRAINESDKEINGADEESEEADEETDTAGEETNKADEETLKLDESMIDYKLNIHVRKIFVTCAALSLDGCYIALGFDNGIIEVADIDHQRTICQLQRNPAIPPAWIEFVHGSHRVATEDVVRKIMILADGMTPVNLGILSHYPAGTTASNNGLFVVRVQRSLDNPWYDNMTLISVSGDPSIQHLASPPFSPSSQSSRLAIPHRQMLGFSPGAHYVGAFDGTWAVTWSTESCQCIAGYRVTNFEYWIINPNVPPTCSYLIPDPIFTQATLPLAEGSTARAHHSDADVGHDSDESWIKRPFYDLSPSREVCLDPAATRTPLIDNQASVWLNGRLELVLPRAYGSINDLQDAWYGHRVPNDHLEPYRPQSSRDGTRFLVQRKLRTPIVVDISQVV